MNAFGGKALITRPPEKGVFPLDHDGECKDFMQKFLSCIKENKSNHLPCKIHSKNYLKCRMERGLMQKENLNNLGFQDEYQVYEKPILHEGIKEETGFIAGLGVKGSRKN